MSGRKERIEQAHSAFSITMNLHRNGRTFGSTHNIECNSERQDEVGRTKKEAGGQVK